MTEAPPPVPVAEAGPRARVATVAGPRVVAICLGIASAAWAVIPVLGAGWPSFALAIVAACVAASSLRVALLDVPERPETYYLPAAERAWYAFLTVIRLASWEEIGCAAILWLEVLHSARPWHTAVLGALLVAYLLAVHVAESGAIARDLLRRQARVLALGACLLALGAAAAAAPVASSGPAAAALHVLAVIAVIAAAILVLPG